MCRDDHPFEIVKLFEDLRYQAKDNGQEVVSLVGNHEIQNLYGTPDNLFPHTIIADVDE